ncbi:MAG: ABC transporter permease subunit [Bacillota bacterium]
MRVTLALLKQYAKDQRLATGVWTAVMAFLTYAVAAATPSVTAENFVLELTRGVPPGLARLYGDLFAYKYPADAFLQFKWMLFFPVLMAVFGALAAMAVVAREVERRTADFVMALPVTRTRLLLTRFSALAFNVALLHFSSYFVLWLGLRLARLPASFAAYTAFYTGSFFLTLALAAFTLWLSVALDEYTLAVRLGLVTGITLWSLHLTSRVLGGPRWFNRLLLFGWLDTEAVIARGEFPWGAVATGGALATLFLALAVAAFARKEIKA